MPLQHKFALQFSTILEHRQWRQEKQKAQAKEARKALQSPPVPVSTQPAVGSSSPSPVRAALKLGTKAKTETSKPVTRHPNSTSHAADIDQLIEDILSLSQHNHQPVRDSEPQLSDSHPLWQRAQHLADTAKQLVGRLSLTQKSDAAWGLSHVSRELAQPLWAHMDVSFEVVPHFMPGLEIQVRTERGAHNPGLVTDKRQPDRHMSVMFVSSSQQPKSSSEGVHFVHTVSEQYVLQKQTVSAGAV